MGAVWEGVSLVGSRGLGLAGVAVGEGAGERKNEAGMLQGRGPGASG